ncbi:gamma-glutamyl-gamma-aminobutyrate hydrolase family protein [Mesorhizobium sp.]|uniref:glutamine amidotransferase-related protein n=1 Tax=Mesorhizobium sp. TaxID=1871066 RepID=UPI0025C30A09|nr:gamma-glutamyl-gamma-aminobutyrate hydrolase family protein [Mesorhizobium sp.]
MVRQRAAIGRTRGSTIAPRTVGWILSVGPETIVARVVLVRHEDGPEDDRVVEFFRAHGVLPQTIRPFLGERLDDVDASVVGSVIFGGKFNVFDDHEYPFLRDEKEWAEQCLKQNVPLLGICLGAQVMATVLGAKVGPLPGDPGEFGYYEIVATEVGKAYLPERLHVAEAHYHQFEIPAGADLLAKSELFEHQAFRYGEKAFGFQFHPEASPSVFRRWQQDPGKYVRPGVQDRAKQDKLMNIHDAAQYAWFMEFQERFFEPAVEAACFK